MRKFYQKEWFGIDFQSFTELDHINIADASFYDKFYDKFYRRFSSYEELPEDWRLGKRQIADLILKQTNKNERLLSIGSGNGYVEYLLWKEGRVITSVEPSHKSTRFLEQSSNVPIYHGYFPDCLRKEDNPPFDWAYMIAIEYVFDYDQLIRLLEDIRGFKIKNLLLTSVCTYNKSILRFTKDMTKEILASLGLYELGQLWGYSRTRDELIQALKIAGFKSMETGKISKNHFWIKGSQQQK